jgi:hypothetical protein
LIILKNSIFRGWTDAGANRRASLARTKYGNVLRLLSRAFVRGTDTEVLP